MDLDADISAPLDQNTRTLTEQALVEALWVILEPIFRSVKEQLSAGVDRPEGSSVRQRDRQARHPSGSSPQSDRNPSQISDASEGVKGDEKARRGGTVAENGPSPLQQQQLNCHRPLQQDPDLFPSERSHTILSRWSSAEEEAKDQPCSSPPPKLPLPTPPHANDANTTCGGKQGGASYRDEADPRSSSPSLASSPLPPLTVVAVPRGVIEETAAHLASSLALHGALFDICQAAMRQQQDRACCKGVVRAWGAVLANILLSFPVHRDAYGAAFSRIAPMLVRLVAAEACGVMSLPFGHPVPPLTSAKSPQEEEPSAPDTFNAGVSAKVAQTADDDTQEAKKPGRKATRSLTASPTSARPLPAVLNLSSRQQEEIATVMRTLGVSTSAISLFGAAESKVSTDELDRDIKLLRSVSAANSGTAQDVSPSSPSKRTRGRLASAPGAALGASLLATVHTEAAAMLAAVEQDWSLSFRVHPSTQASRSNGEADLTLDFADPAVPPAEEGTPLSAEAAEERAAQRFFFAHIAARDRAPCLRWQTQAIRGVCAELCCLAAEVEISSRRLSEKIEASSRLPFETRAFTVDNRCCYDAFLAQQMVPQSLLFGSDEQRGSRECPLSLMLAASARDADSRRTRCSAVAHAAHGPPPSPSDPARAVGPRSRKRSRSPSPTLQRHGVAPAASAPAVEAATTVASPAMGLESFDGLDAVAWLPLAHALATPGPPATDACSDVFKLGPASATAKALFLDVDEEKDAETKAALQEVGAVLATVDCVFAARTVRDLSAWRYGRTRIPAVSDSVVFLTFDGREARNGPGAGREDATAAAPALDAAKWEGEACADTEASLHAGTDSPTSADRPSQDTRESGDEDGEDEESWFACARFMHETGLLYNTESEVFALDVEAKMRW